DGTAQGGERKRTAAGPLRASAGTSRRQAGVGGVGCRAGRGETAVEPEGGRGMKNPLGNMGNILKQAQAMQAKMAKVQEEASTKTVTGTAGGGSATCGTSGTCA